MNDYVDDTIDVVVLILAFVLVLAIAVWGGASVMRDAETSIRERTSIYNEIGTVVKKPVLQAKDALMIYAVADAFTPNPKSVTLLVRGASGQHVTFDTHYIENRNSILNALWSSAFRGNMDQTVKDISLDKSGVTWTIRLE